MQSRLIATQIVRQVIEDHCHLNVLLGDAEFLKKAGKEKPVIQEMSYGAIRWYTLLETYLDKLLDKPIKQKDRDIKYLLIIGLYQLKFMNIAKHAVVSETVQTCQGLKKHSAKGLVNAVLRRYLREHEKLQPLDKHHAHPDWLADRIRQDWPDAADKIFIENNKYPPMFLRVNKRKYSRTEYLEKLNKLTIGCSTPDLTDTALELEHAIDVTMLPDFQQGSVSIQDLAAQLCVDLLDLKPGQHVLDACAAPGGKSTHIFETEPAIASLTLLEKNPDRIHRLKANLERLDVNAKLLEVDAAEIDSWWDGQEFDRILLDAPCSATGVIRRHPDIKVNRTENDVDDVNKEQIRLLDNLWPTLKKNGLLLYASCSILKQENFDVIRQFLAKHETDCIIKPIKSDWGLHSEYGTQILTGDHNMDGFFYACLQKK